LALPNKDDITSPPTSISRNLVYFTRQCFIESHRVMIQIVKADVSRNQVTITG